ncbi:hypothetical protein [Veronia pacifica]|uniref:Uncharacterized protein n=1 Tax=Veronia pacifica TaxID=1080227 RepID=A0A1C3EMB0_9GAMM|nr:hypothetical protein [Veronia pacifica]ODA34355.1 hypothetical protein A8L45_06420 [Veronia pacifica]
MNIVPGVKNTPVNFLNDQSLIAQQNRHNAVLQLQTLPNNGASIISGGYGFSAPSFFNNSGLAQTQGRVVYPSMLQPSVTTLPEWGHFHQKPCGQTVQSPTVKPDGDKEPEKGGLFSDIVGDIVDAVNEVVDAPFDIADNVVYRGSKTLFGLVDTPARIALECAKVPASAVEIAGSAVVGFAKGFIQGVDNTNEDFHNQFDRNKK